MNANKSKSMILILVCNQCFQVWRYVPPIVLSWNSWNCPLTKRSTRLDFPTADSPNSTSLNWQILLPVFGPLGRVAPPLLAMSHRPLTSSGHWPDGTNPRKYLDRTKKRRQSVSVMSITYKWFKDENWTTCSYISNYEWKQFMSDGEDFLKLCICNLL